MTHSADGFRGCAGEALVIRVQMPKKWVGLISLGKMWCRVVALPADECDSYWVTVSLLQTQLRLSALGCWSRLCGSPMPCQLAPAWDVQIGGARGRLKALLFVGVPSVCCSCEQCVFTLPSGWQFSLHLENQPHCALPLRDASTSQPGTGTVLPLSQSSGSQAHRALLLAPAKQGFLLKSLSFRGSSSKFPSFRNL